VSQEERSVFRKVIVSVILSKKKMYMYMCPIPKGFRDTAISLYSSKLKIRKKYVLRKGKVKFSSLQALEALRVVRG
jgi:hypothetical protein